VTFKKAVAILRVFDRMEKSNAGGKYRNMA
jgi:hypothetical protein